MQTKEISEYLNNDYLSAALYLAYRACPNVCDGLKVSGRKIVYTVKKDKIKDEIKVSSLGGKVTSDAGYLHGEASIEGAIVTMGQRYTGANNLSILEPVGNFGTRFSNTASSARYIFAKPSAYFDKLFRPEDDNNLVVQEFEGDIIEPRFYVPTLPMLLINGCSGIGVGFRTTIYSRSVKNLISLIKARLNQGRVLKKWLYPSWEGFTGTVEPVSAGKWKVSGKAEQNRKKLTVTELPIGMELKTYLNILDELRDSGVIASYLDYSDPRTDLFNFEITLSVEESLKSLDTIMEDLKLVEVISENLTCLDRNNAIQEYDSIDEIFDEYFKVKLEYMGLRIKSETARLKKELDELEETVRFILGVIDGSIDVKAKRSVLEEKLKKDGYIRIPYLLSLPISSLTADKVKELKDKVKVKKAELKAMQAETPASLWLKDLDELEAVI